MLAPAGAVTAGRFFVALDATVFTLGAAYGQSAVEAASLSPSTYPFGTFSSQAVSWHGLLDYVDHDSGVKEREIHIALW